MYFSSLFPFFYFNSLIDTNLKFGKPIYIRLRHNKNEVINASHKILASAIAIALIFAAAPGLISLTKAKHPGEQIPLNIEYEGNKYVQTYGFIPEQEILLYGRPGSYETSGDRFYEIFVPNNQRSPYDEIYLRVMGVGFVIFIRERIAEGLESFQNSIAAYTPTFEIADRIDRTLEGSNGLATVPVNPALGFTAADKTAKRVLGYWEKNDDNVKTTQYLLFSDCSPKNIRQSLENNSLRYWYNIGHGFPDKLLMVEGMNYIPMNAQEFSGLEGIEGCGIFLNSCNAFNGNLKEIITQQKPAFFVAGKVGLPVDSSEEVSGDFWYYYSVVGVDEMVALNLAISKKQGSSGWYGLWT